MLVLKRKLRQKIVLETPDGQKITVSVSAIEGQTARIAIDADRSVTVYREELAK